MLLGNTAWYSGNMKSPARHAVVDTRTGELYDIQLVPRGRAIGGPWVKVFQRSKVALLLKHPELRSTSYRVFMYLEGVTAWHNQVPGSAEVAAALDLRRDVVARSYGELLRAGFIVKHRGRYHLSPEIAWKGTERELDAFCRELYAAPVLLLGGTRG